MAPVQSAIDRREFLQRLAAGGILLVIPGRDGAPTSLDHHLRRLAGGESSDAAFEPTAYLRIGDDGSVTVIVHRSEMGQGIRTSLAMAVADELEADWNRVRVEQAPGDEKKYGSQETDGSHSIRGFLTPMRQAGATGRAMLETAAAAQWGVPVSEVKARHHQVVHTPSGRVKEYGELVPVARTLRVPTPDQLRLKEPSEFRYIGKNIPTVDLADMTTGRAKYGCDQHLDGMKFAVIARPPVYGGTLATVDSAAAERVPGVERIVRLAHSPPPSGMSPLGGVAVIARSTWAAIQGRNALKVTWHDGPNASYDSRTYRLELERSVRAPGKVARRQGDVVAALASASRRLEAEYYCPHLAHAPMEPVTALADVKDGRCEIWAPTQAPQGARDAVAKALGFSSDNVRVNVTLLGGGFGRKTFPDFIIEAALLSRAVAAPVQVVWTREDDVQHDFYHAVALERLEAGLDAQGKVVAWMHRSAIPSIDSTFSPNVLYQADWELSIGMIDIPYAIANLQLEAAAATPHVRLGWYRAVLSTPHQFAIGSFIDELAHAAGKDPRDFILDLLGPDRIVDMDQAGLVGKASNYNSTFGDYPVDTSRYRRVLEVVTEQSGWGTPLPRGQGRGLAVLRASLSYLATVVHVDVKADGTVVIPRVDVAIDPGFVVHPDRVRAQVEGGAIMGLGNTLGGEITFRNGRAEQSNFNAYRVLRLSGAPREIRVHIVPSAAKPGGVGEPGVAPAAPALCNAIFAATGKRIRTLPVGAQLGARS